MTPLMGGLAIAVFRLGGFASDTAAAAMPKDPCGLLERAEIQTVASNAKIGNGVSSADPLSVSCVYTWGP